MRNVADGSVLSGATASSRGPAARPRMAHPTTGIVVRYHPRDESPSGMPTVDLLLPRWGQICWGALLAGGGDTLNGEAWVPRPATADASGLFDLAQWDKADPATLDGDRVLVVFLDGDPGRAVASAPLPSRAATWQPSVLDGTVRVVRHQGLEVLLDNQGDLRVGRTGLRLLVQAARVMLDAARVDLGSGAVDFAAKGTTLLAWLRAFTTAVASHVHPSNGTPAPTLQQYLVPPQQQPPDSVLSTKVRVQ